ncbi:hypothetical protein PVK06_010986 [Gossypium arboreum]|uniref:TF-B3 domain-containing protein n=1 Tax=Gossypium arboreum TaxID=29729 RepID=A0ABR0Q8T3_GOSAR|nr:hypothetical protein PVK06_010986 [Gossypium arboreum]
MELETVVALLVSDQEIDLASKLNYHQAQNMLQVPSVPKSVPASFAKETSLAEEPSTVIKDSEGRKWEINILVDAKSNVRLGAGWSQFVQENKLEAGDTISFQHIPNTGNVIYFKIISNARAANYVLPYFAKVYSFIGSVFDPGTSGHLQN